MKRLFARTAALLCAAIAFSAGAQDFPTKPLRMVVPFAPGGGADFVARAIAAPLAKRLGQPVVVDNKPGAGAVLGADTVAKAPADGHTLLYTTPGPQMTSPYLMARLPYDPVHDLVPVSEVAIVPNVLVVNKNLPVHSIEELIAYAKANPGKVNFASAGQGASSHLAGELFKQAAGVSIMHIPYRGTGPALADLLSGQVQMAIDSIAAYKPHIDSGALRPLGVATVKPSPLLPGVPPIAQTLKGFDAAPVNYISVPKNTPRAVIDRLNREINAVLASPELKEQFAANGVVPQGSTPEEMAVLVRSEAAKWKKVIETSGARID
ncbi:tripartite tricarboxylate transporter substrate binding protein [Pseudacidovorax sp. RU35E]|uniref:Bug family tripartite tricarboxylate transporter substrate binding protein n=1 Tax=Pseudacidovorax sp. RU35E TaxID=1907403 RepID=UPI0009540FF2|nr:tripartite tricarboxylate transporter substrate binding protein [Pseudacidovorax sp. RU35E]SIQ57718.1 Tripartite-type tricarboxylate transporter, receptor component TctC [Pseudacidovorax sp. RU35E]